MLPQVATSKFETQSGPHWWKPCEHSVPQSLPSQIAIAFGAAGHALHRLPQVIGSKFETQLLPQRWYPAMQVKSQVPLVHEGIEFGPPLHEMHCEPHAVGVFAGTHETPQRFEPVGHAQVLRWVSQICPLLQWVFVWQPNTHRLEVASQKKFVGQAFGLPGTQLVGTFMHMLPVQYWPGAHERPHAPQLP